MSPPLTLASSNLPKVKIHPSVLMSICDSYLRRNSKQVRVVGTLLGFLNDGHLELKNCYAVPHNETNDSVDFDMTQHQAMSELYLKVNPKEVVIGWYTTGDGNFDARDSLIQDFYCANSQIANPVVLMVDTAMENGQMDINVFCARQLTLKDKLLAVEFLPVEYQVNKAALNRLGVDILNDNNKTQANVDSLTLSISRLQQAIDKVEQHVKLILDGKAPKDPKLGRHLSDALSAVPYIKLEQLEKMVTDSSQDSLLIMYLANLVHTQLSLADRLGTNALPLL